MKTFVRSLLRCLLVFTLFFIFAFHADANALVVIPDQKGVLEFLKVNWAQIALVVSEAAALLPSKVNGIVQGILQFIPILFGGKTKKQ